MIELKDTSDFKPCQTDMRAFAIDFRNGLLSMSKSMIDLQSYVAGINQIVKEKKLKEIEESIKNLEDTSKIIEGLGQRKWDVVRKVIIFMSKIKWRFDMNEINPIACTEKYLVEEYENYKNVQNRIKKAIKLNALVCVSEYNSKIEHIAKTYWMNKKVYEDLIKIYKEHIRDEELDEIIEKNEKQSYDESGYDIEDSAEITDESRIRISSFINMRIDDVSDAKIIEILNKRYPMYLDGLKIAERLNENLPDVEKIKWEWSIKRTKRNGHEYLMKIGFRASSSLCGYKEHENENRFYKGVWRKEYLKEKFGDKYDSYDVNGSIWRLTYNLNHKELLGDEVDVYNEFWKNASESGFKSKDERDLFKAIAMRLYFGNGSKMGNSFVYTWNELLKELGEEELAGKDDIEACQLYMESAREYGGEWLGRYYGSEIFMHESYVHLKMLEKMIEKSNVIQVYDGFYFECNKFDKSYLDSLYKDVIIDYKDKYSKFLQLKFNNYIYSGNEFFLADSGEGQKQKTSKKKVQKSDSRKFDDFDIDLAVREQEQIDCLIEKVHKGLVKMFQNADLPKSFLNEFEERYSLKMTSGKSWYIGCPEKNKVLRSQIEGIILNLDKQILQIRETEVK